MSTAVADQVPATQFTAVAGLPGSGLPLSARGALDPRGAVHINIPVAYTPADRAVLWGVSLADHSTPSGDSSRPPGRAWPF